MANNSFNDIYGFNSRQPQLPAQQIKPTTVTNPDTGLDETVFKYQQTQEAPSSFGVLRCACFLWPECPFYAIKHQEYTLTMSPQTVTNLESDVRDKLSFMSDGDGVFMKISESNISTYLAQKRRPLKTELLNCDEFNPEKCKKPIITDETSRFGIINTKDLDFLPVWDKFHKVLGYSPYETGIGNNVILAYGLTNIESTELSFFAGNQMWIEIGSIYQETVRSYPDYGKSYELLGGTSSSNENLKSDLQNFFSPKWFYKTFTGAPDTVIKTLDLIENKTSPPPYIGLTPPPSAKAVVPTDFNYDPLANQNISQIQDDKEYLYKMPAISGIDGLSDPLDLIRDLAATATAGESLLKDKLGASEISTNGKTKSFLVADINPGLHWGVKKHIPLLNNQGFSLHFVHLSPEPFKVANSFHRYSLLKKFAWLDPLQQNGLNNCAQLETENADQLEAIRENHRVAFDFANQQYILIKFPPDYDAVSVSSSTRNLYLLICENMPPIVFRDSGYQIDCETGAAILTVGPNNNSEIIWAGTNDPTNDQGVNSPTTPQITSTSEPKKKLTYIPGFYEIARCDFVSSATLLNQPDLKMHFRIHSGRLVIQFMGAGVDGRHWIIGNIFEEPEDINATLTHSANANINLKKKTIPFNFTQGSVHVYGGNRKIAFGYSPLKFEPSVTIPFPPQNFQGAPGVDLKPENIHILLSDSTYPYLPVKWYTNFAAQYTDYASKLDPYRDDRKSCDDVDVSANKLAKLPRETTIQTKDRPENLMASFNTQLRILRAEKFIKQNSSSELNHYLNFSLQMNSGSLALPDLKSKGTRVWPYGETPVVRAIRLLLPADKPAWKQQNIDLSKYVLSFSDEWSESDFQKITHSGNISFLVPQIKPNSNGEDNRIRNILLGLVDKNFYLRICLWWDRYDQPNANPIYRATLNPKDDANFPAPEKIGKGQLDYNVMFTGFCTGGNVTVENNKQVMNCALNDYSKVLQDMLFFNSPYFDRMTDTFAVREILNMAKFRFCQNAPAYLVDISCLDKNVKSNIRVDGLTDIRVTKYVLPGSYNQLESPAHKPADNTPLWETIEKFALQSSKITYFDSLGRFRYVDMPFDSLLFEQRTSNKTTKAAEYNKTVAEAKKFGIYCASFKENLLTDEATDAPRHLLIDDYKYERIVADTKNRILIISTSPNGELFVAGDINYDAFYNTEKEGFIGYEKIFVQMDGIFGSEATVKQMVAHYTKMYIPPLKISFKARGYRCMTCMTPVLFLGLGSKKLQPLIVSKVSNEIDVQGNRWTQNFDTIWLFEGRGVDFGETREMEVDFKGVVNAPKDAKPPKQP